MAKQPNIIFILTDDQRYDAMNFAGNSQVYTPNLDKLASESVKFNNAFHVAPICLPSRASIQLGKFINQHNTGFDMPSFYTISNKEYEESYPVLLRKHGYYTGYVGKFGFYVTEEKKLKAKLVLDPQAPKDDPYYKMTEQVEDQEQTLPIKEYDYFFGDGGKGGYRPVDGKFFDYENEKGFEHLTDFTTDKALSFLDEAKKQDKPFSLGIGFKAPHMPFDPQPQWVEFYKDVTINRMANDKMEYFLKLPKVVRTHSRNADEYFGSRNSKNQYMLLGNWKHEENFQKSFKAYYGLISGVDEAVGKIREKLQELGLDKDTIIIYTSDNGYFCGSKQLGGKELLYEESIKAPMIVHDPREGSKTEDKWIDGMISHVDICPTILDYAGIEKTESMFGKSFVPLITGEKEEINDAVYGENDFNDHYAYITEVEDPENYQSIHSKYVRTKKFKYVRYHLCHPIVEEMWAIDKDPLETENLVGNPAYEDKLNEMRKLLDDFVANTRVEPK